MKLPKVEFKNHPILKNLKLNFTDKEKVYSNIIFVGENGCGKTTILNELFNYYKSPHIDRVEQKNFDDSVNIKCLYIEQDIKYRNAINNIKKKMDGKKVYKNSTIEKDLKKPNKSEVITKNKDNIVNNVEMLFEKVKDFKSERITCFLQEHNSDLMDDVTKLVSIDGNIEVPNVDKFSSGEQEILLRLERMKENIPSDMDMILLDEPETGLHPKWQLKIIPFILDILKDNRSGERDLQLFIASHSENILKSVFKRSDTLVVRLYKDKGEIRSENITNMNTVLKETTIAEIQYLVFGIISSEYYNHLYGLLLFMCGGTQKKVERYFINKYNGHLKDICNPYGYSYGQQNSIETLPTYIRNAIDHPENDDRKYTEEDLEKALVLLRNEIKEFDIRFLDE